MREPYARNQMSAASCAPVAIGDRELLGDTRRPRRLGGQAGVEPQLESQRLELAAQVDDQLGEETGQRFPRRIDDYSFVSRTIDRPGHSFATRTKPPASAPSVR